MPGLAQVCNGAKRTRPPCASRPDPRTCLCRLEYSPKGSRRAGMYEYIKYIYMCVCVFVYIYAGEICGSAQRRVGMRVSSWAIDLLGIFQKVPNSRTGSSKLTRGLPMHIHTTSNARSRLSPQTTELLYRHWSFLQADCHSQPHYRWRRLLQGTPGHASSHRSAATEGKTTCPRHTIPSCTAGY